jgi:hypothetical protein
MKDRKVVEDLSEKVYEKDLADLRERVVRLEVQMTEVSKRVESLTSYTRQLFDYLNRSGRE